MELTKTRLFIHKCGHPCLDPKKARKHYTHLTKDVCFVCSKKLPHASRCRYCAIRAKTLNPN